ncbi:MAG TPA: hypothetical protein VKY27_10730 [Bacteriovoracaceae bacterium]|nr:hypothetical protein [Bacteriovoracaceae bacterium]
MFTRFLFLSLLLITSCGSSKEEKVESAIDQALTHLSSNKCDDALKILKDGKDFENPVYLQVLSSAYACKAGIEVVEVITELEDFNATKVLNELSTKKFAQTTNLDSYHYLNKSLETIFNSTAQTSQAAREEAFGTRKGQDLGMQALLYSIVEVSKFVNYFGNTETGQKGDGQGSNRCFLDYSNNLLLFNLLPATNSCVSETDGHALLDLTKEEGKAYACQGVLLINNALDILESIKFGNSEELKSLKKISEKISNLRDFIITVDPSLESLFSIRDQEACLDLENEKIQTFIFSIYEVGFE